MDPSAKSAPSGHSWRSLCFRKVINVSRFSTRLEIFSTGFRRLLTRRRDIFSGDFRSEELKMLMEPNGSCARRLPRFKRESATRKQFLRSAQLSRWHDEKN